MFAGKVKIINNESNIKYIGSVMSLDEEKIQELISQEHDFEYEELDEYGNENDYPYILKRDINSHGDYLCFKEDELRSIYNFVLLNLENNICQSLR